MLQNLIKYYFKVHKTGPASIFSLIIWPWFEKSEIIELVCSDVEDLIDNWIGDAEDHLELNKQIWTEYKDVLEASGVSTEAGNY